MIADEAASDCDSLSACEAKLTELNTQIDQKKQKISQVKEQINQTDTSNISQVSKLLDQVEKLEIAKKKLEADEINAKAKKYEFQWHKADDAEKQALDTAQTAKNNISKLESAYSTCIGKPTKQCAEDVFKKLNDQFVSAQTNFNSCRKTKSETSEAKTIDCSPLEKVMADIALRITKINAIRHSYVSVDAKDILTIHNQSPFIDLKDVLNKLIDLLIKMVGVVALVFLVIGGFWLVVAAGSDNEIQKAKGVIQYSITGLAVALLAYLIVAAVQGIFYR